MKTYTTLGDGIDRLRFEDREVTGIKPNEVLVEMSAAALNYRDLPVVNGINNRKPNEPQKHD